MLALISTEHSTSSPRTIRYHLIEVNPAAVGPLPEGQRQRHGMARRFHLENGTQKATMDVAVYDDEDKALDEGRYAAGVINHFGIETMGEDGHWHLINSWIQIQRVEYEGEKPVHYHEGVMVER